MRAPSPGGSDTSYASSLPVQVPTHSDTLETGVLYEYYKGEFDTLPDFNGLLEPHGRGIMNSVSINPTTEFVLFDRSLQATRSKEAGNYAVRFTTRVLIPHAGLWTFYLLSNDGSALYISGKKVVQNDGSHYATEKEGKIRIRAPGHYPMTITYFHKEGKLLEGVRSGPCLTLSYYFPGTGWLPYPPDYVAKQVVPATHLFYDPHDQQTMQILSAMSEAEAAKNMEMSEYRGMDETHALEEDLRDMSTKIFALQRSLEDVHKRFEILFEKTKQQPISRTELNTALQLCQSADSDEARDEAFKAKLAFVEKHLADTQKLQCSHFFLLGLQMKMDLRAGNFVLRVSHSIANL